MGHKSRIKARRNDREFIGPYIRGWNLRHVWYLLLSRSEIIGLRSSHLLWMLGVDSGSRHGWSFWSGSLDLDDFPPERIQRYPLKSVSQIVFWARPGTIDIHPIEGPHDRYRRVGRTSLNVLETLQKLYPFHVQVRWNR